MSADEEVPSDGPAEADPFADLKAADRAAEEKAVAAADAPVEEDPFAALKAADRAAEEAAAEPVAAPAAEDDPFAALKEVDRAAEEQAEAAPSEPAPSDPAPDAANAEIAEDAPADVAEAPAEPAPETASPVFRYDDKLYEPVSPDAPAGAAIEFYHFSEMDQELAWPQNEFGRPDSAQRPNFRAVRETTLGFLNGNKDFKPTRDVRPMLALAIAEAGDKGPVGLAKALDLFVSFATSHWDALHPQKEDSDDDELMSRMEEMRKYMNPQIISMAVDSVGIAKSPRVGDLTTRTFAIAAAKATPRGGEFAPNSDALKTLLSEEPDAKASIVEAHAAYRHAIDQLTLFEGFLAEHPDVDPVDLASVAAVLDTQAGFLAPYVGDAGSASAGADAEDGTGEAGAAGGVSAQISVPKTLDAALALMDDVLVFYARSGRSSPVPLGLIALRDLMASDFNSWISHTASSGLSEAAINISAVDASRLAGFASGEVPVAAPAAPVALDFSTFDKSLYDTEGAYAGLDSAIYTLQQRLLILEPAYAESSGEEPPAEGAEPPLAAELLVLRTAIDQLQEARVAMEKPPAPTASEDGGGHENTSDGDANHSRITDRSGVKTALEGIAAYFEREEPSSPAPAYLKRLRSLVDARFTEIARELMPEGGGEAKLRLEPRTNLR